MRQQTTAPTTTTTTTEKIDPLMRIQEEIKEVVRREQEYRQLTSAISPTSLEEYDHQHNDNDDENDKNNNNNNDDSCNSISISPIPTLLAADTIVIDAKTTPAAATSTISPTTTTTTLEHASVVVTTLTATDDNSSSNTPSLALSVNSKESLDEHHSDDSGISASSSPVNGTSANNNHNKNSNSNNDSVKTLGSIKEQRYIGPNCYNMTPEPPQQKLITRTISTPHLAAATSKSRQFTYNPAHKGVMQRFIASRGKLQLNNNNIINNYNNSAANATSSNTIMLNSKSAATLLLTTNALSSASMGNNTSLPLTAPIMNSNGGLIGIIPTGTMTPAIIERDADGRPIRPGYIPVEVKIQRELKDLKSRESELKKIRKTRQSTPDLLDSIDNENVETDDDDDSEVEHCYGPGKLRSAKSYGELCDTNLSMSPRATPSPDCEYRMNRNGNGVGGVGGIYGNVGGGMRPAMSLAQLCDLTPEEAPSSHRLIAQWESLIQQNA